MSPWTIIGWVVLFLFVKILFGEALGRIFAGLFVLIGVGVLGFLLYRAFARSPVTAAIDATAVGVWAVLHRKDKTVPLARKRIVGAAVVAVCGCVAAFMVAEGSP